MRMRRPPSSTSIGSSTRSTGRGSCCTLRPGAADQVDEGRRAAVHHGQLGSVDRHAHVVDAEAVERGEQMLDRADARVAASERGGEPRRGDAARPRRDLDRVRTVAAHEHDARAGPRRRQRSWTGAPLCRPLPVHDTCSASVCCLRTPIPPERRPTRRRGSRKSKPYAGLRAASARSRRLPRNPFESMGWQGDLRGFRRACTRRRESRRPA